MNARPLTQFPDQRITVDVQIEQTDWNTLPEITSRVKEAVKSALQGASVRSSCEVCVLLTSDYEVQTLNKDFRGKDKPTNVLSFPALESNEIDNLLETSLHDDPDYLGDVALAYGTVIKEAKEQGKSPINHLTHLVIHGTLHLIGYDHEDPKDADKMEALEASILKSTFNIDNPYNTTPCEDK